MRPSDEWNRIGRIRVEADAADVLYWAIYWYTSQTIGDKIIVRDAGGDVEEFKDRLHHLHRLRDELHRLYGEKGWKWPGRDDGTHDLAAEG